MRNQLEQYKITEKITKERINEALRISKEKDLTPENVVEAAKSKSNPLHDLFEWDDTKAGYKWRLQQARVFINEIKVIVENKEIYAFENVSIQVVEEENDGVKSKRIYEPIGTILSSEEKRQQLLRQAIGYMEYWKNKYSMLHELKPIFEVVEKVKKKLKK